MTTILGYVNRGVTFIAADTLITSNGQVLGHQKKIFKKENFIYAMSGDCAVDDVVHGVFSIIPKNTNHTTVKTMIMEAVKIAKNKGLEIGDFTILIADGSKICVLYEDGFLLKIPRGEAFCIGTGGAYAKGYFEGVMSLKKEEGMSEGEVAMLMITSILFAAEHDLATGGNAMCISSNLTVA